METLANIPVRLDWFASVSPVVEAVRSRITRRAQELFVERGSAEGHATEDWLAAERELIERMPVAIHVAEKDIRVEIELPSLDLTNLTVYFGTMQIAVAADPAADGRQILQVIDLPRKTELTGIEAEQTGRLLQIKIADPAGI